MKINLDNIIDFSQGGSKNRLPHFRAVSTIAPNMMKGVAGDFVGTFNFYSFSNDLDDIGMKSFLECLYGEAFADISHEELIKGSKLYKSIMQREWGLKEHFKTLTKEQIFMARGLV